MNNTLRWLQYWCQVYLLLLCFNVFKLVVLSILCMLCILVTILVVERCYINSYCFIIFLFSWIYRLKVWLLVTFLLWLQIWTLAYSYGFWCKIDNFNVVFVFFLSLFISILEGKINFMTHLQKMMNWLHLWAHQLSQRQTGKWNATAYRESHNLHTLCCCFFQCLNKETNLEARRGFCITQNVSCCLVLALSYMSTKTLKWRERKHSNDKLNMLPDAEKQCSRQVYIFCAWRLQSISHKCEKQYWKQHATVGGQYFLFWKTFWARAFLPPANINTALQFQTIRVCEYQIRKEKQHSNAFLATVQQNETNMNIRHLRRSER